MEGTPPPRLPLGFRVGTVFEKTLRHVVPPDGRFGICGAPVAPETIVAHIADDDRVCRHCIKRLKGRKPFVAQPSPRKAKPSPSPAAARAPASEPVREPTPEPPRVKIELPRRIATLLDAFFDPVESPGSSSRGPVGYELLVAEAVALADVLEDMGEMDEHARVVRAVAQVAHPGR